MGHLVELLPWVVTRKTKVWGWRLWWVWILEVVLQQQKKAKERAWLAKSHLCRIWSFIAMCHSSWDRCGLLAKAGAWSCCHLAACLTTKGADRDKLNRAQSSHDDPAETMSPTGISSSTGKSTWHCMTLPLMTCSYTLLYITRTRHAVLDIGRAANSMQYCCWSGDLVWNTDWIFVCVF